MKKVLLCLLATFIFSCEKPSIDDSEKVTTLQKIDDFPSIQNQDGILKFRSVEDFLVAVDKIGNMTEDEYSRWSDLYKFKSRYKDYLQEIERDTTDNFIPRKNGAIIKNKEDGYSQLNSLNSSYARVTNTDGIVYIGDESYQVDYESIKVVNGASNDKAKLLVNTMAKEDLKKYGIHKSDIITYDKKDYNARISDEKIIERKVQQGADLKDEAYWDWYVLAIFEVKGYCMPCTPTGPTFPGNDGINYNRITTTLEANYWSDGLFTKNREIPQRYELSWTGIQFCGPCAGGQQPVTGSYTESNVRTVLRTLTDTQTDLGAPFWNGYDILVKAFDYKGSELKSSETRIIRSQ